MAKQRLDLLLVERSLAESRQQAQRLIQAGLVRVNDAVIDKVGTRIDREAAIAVAHRPRYVSRGGEKLAKALEGFGIIVNNRVCLDGGISTGGFTDCLFQAGARQVYGIDVGYGQVDWKIRTDPRLVLRERVNLRYLTPADLYGDLHPMLYPDLGVVDVSFISLKKVLPAIWALLRPPRTLITLIKPQFEVGRDRVGKKGVVWEVQDQATAIAQVLEAAQELGWHIQHLTWSPLKGPSGNIEYLAEFQEGNSAPATEPEVWSQEGILTLTQQAFAALKT